MLKGVPINERFKNFHARYKHLNIQESIEFYSVFSGHPFLDFIPFDEDLPTCIEKFILNRKEDLKPYFFYDNDANFQKDLESLLMRLAIGDRKSYTAYKKENISQLRSRHLFKSLLEKNIIKKEQSREKPFLKTKSKPLKKELRRYEIQDKIRFVDNFTRFWFTYCCKDEAPSLAEIKNSLDQFISLCFEELSNELIIHRLGLENIESYGSYWDKKIEIDLLITTKDGTVIAGESKWKNTKVCKNILNSLERKCALTALHVEKFVLFSKSGFSKELLMLQRPDVMLCDIQLFKELYD